MILRPRFSIVMPLRNAATILRDALQSLENQSYKDFELVVVDGKSTDGTLDLLADASTKFAIDVVSEQDRSLGHALAKGLERAKTDLVSILCADERYYPDALATASEWFATFPDAIVCCGRADLIDQSGAVRQGTLNREFDSKAHLACELVLPIAATFFNRARLGPELRYDPEVSSCPDYELWGRLGFRYPKELFKVFDKSLVAALATRDSMSFRPEEFAQLTRDKIAHLENLLAVCPDDDQRETLRRRCIAGINMWSAEQVYSIDPGNHDVLTYCASAAREDPAYQRIADFLDQSNLGVLNQETAAISLIPTEPSATAKALSAIPHFVTFSYWEGAKILERNPLTIKMADIAWGYSALATAEAVPSGSKQPWLLVDLEVRKGSVGIARQIGEKLAGERFVDAKQGRITLMMPLLEGPRTRVLLRNGPAGGSVVTIHSARFLVD